MLRLLLLGGLATAALLLTRRSAGERQDAPEFDEQPPEARRAAAKGTARRRSGPTLKAREQAARELAEELLFKLEKRGGRYSLLRDADVSEPVRRENLTIKEVEETLSNWKLRGFHGG